MPARKKPSPRDEVAELSFEESLAALEELVGRMESADLPLEEMIAAHEKGARLHAHCTELLEGAKKRLETIRVGQDGAAQLDPSAEDAPGDTGEESSHGEADELF